MNSGVLLSSRLSSCLKNMQLGKLMNFCREPRLFPCMKYHISCASKLNYDHNLQNFGKQSKLLKANVYPPQFNRKDSTKNTQSSSEEKVTSELTMRLLNENSFLSWCRNAYLSTAVGLAMITETTTPLGQTAGAVALGVGFMNVFWGTTCHVVNLLRLRQASGMSSLVLFLNICGSMLHCCLWMMVLVCYIGFVDETSEGKGIENLQAEALKDV